MSYYIKHKGGVIMNVNKGVGIIAIILGLLFMIFPIFSACWERQCFGCPVHRAILGLHEW